MRRTLALLGICTVVTLLLPTRLSSGFRDVLGNTLSPVTHWLITRNTRINTAWENISHLGTLRTERNRLQESVVSLVLQQSEFESLRRENEMLRQELGVTGATRSSQKVLARVIVHDPLASDITFTIDVGSEQGIQVGQAAVLQGLLVGRVIEVRENTAVIRSITSPKSRIQVWIAASKEKGILSGDGRSALLTDITQGLTIAPYSIVETSGLGESLPQGIVVGELGEALSKPSDPYQRFPVITRQNITSIESLFILIDGS